MEDMVTNQQFFKGKKILITGHTGFKGSWLCCLLKHYGAEVIGFSLAPLTQPNMFTLLNINANIESIIGDIRDFYTIKRVLIDHQPEIVIHMAAQALVRHSYDHPVETYSTNVMGLINVFEAIRLTESVKCVLNVTSDKCYQNREWHWGYRESDSLGGLDPYSSSKACSELVTSCYRNSYLSQSGVIVASARAGNVIGGGDWSEDRLVPDLVQAFSLQQIASIRNPSAIRPWQHVLEPLSGYLELINYLLSRDGNPDETSYAWNFGPAETDAKTVEWVAQQLAKNWGDGAYVKSEPQINAPHEAHFLKLDTSKSRSILNWQSKWEIELAIEKTIEWYSGFYQGKNMASITQTQIHEYLNDKGD